MKFDIELEMLHRQIDLVFNHEKLSVRDSQELSWQVDILQKTQKKNRQTTA